MKLFLLNKQIDQYPTIKTVVYSSAYLSKYLNVQSANNVLKGFVISS